MTFSEPTDAIVDVVRWARRLTWKDIPDEVHDGAKKRLLDLIGAALAGTQADGIPQLVQVVESWGGGGDSSILGTKQRTSVPLAVMVNAAIARALELDDVHERALLHPTVATAPIALAIAEQDHAIDTRQMITSMVAAQEVMCRLGLAPDYHVSGPLHRPRGWSFTYQCGILGGALTAALLYGLDERTTLDALGNAYTALAGNQQAIQEAVLAIRVQQGVAAQTSVQSADLARAGISGPHEILEGTFGWLTYWHGNRYDRDVVVGELGQRWDVQDTSIKPYPVCRIAHNAVDATLAAVAEADLTSGRHIERLVVHVNSRESWDEVVHPLERRRAPTSPMDAQFSLPFACAIAAVHGAPTLEHVSERGVRDAEVLAVAQRVEPVLDPGFDAVGGRAIPMPVTVDLHLTDGRVVTTRSETPSGHPSKPLSWDSVEAKVRGCATTGGAPADTAVLDEVISTVRDLEDARPGDLLGLWARARSIPV